MSDTQTTEAALDALRERQRELETERAITDARLEEVTETIATLTGGRKPRAYRVKIDKAKLAAVSAPPDSQPGDAA